MDREDLLKFLGNDFGLEDGDFTSLVAMLLIRLGLDNGTLISNPNWVLNASEVTLVQERTDALNQIIAAEGSPEFDARRQATLNDNQEQLRAAEDPTGESFRILVEEFQHDGIQLRNNPLLQGAYEVSVLFNAALATHLGVRFQVDVRVIREQGLPPGSFLLIPTLENCRLAPC